jgi:hypothetical protein
MERSEIRDRDINRHRPDFAALDPGYESLLRSP